MDPIVKLISRIQIKYFSTNILIDKGEFEEQLRFLNSFKEPTCDFDRTYLQHRCQMRQINPVVLFLLNFCSLCAFPFYSIFMIIKSLGNRKTIHQDPESIVYLNCVNGEAFYPAELKKEYSKSFEVDFFDGKILFVKDLFFVLKFIKRHSFSPWLSLRLLYRVAVFRYVIQKYYPKAIAVTGEVNPSGPSITQYCEMFNIEHINLLSGERYFEPSAAFIHFHKFYVWDDHYTKILINLRADKRTKFITHVPAGLQIDLIKNRIESLAVDFTYILGLITEEDVIKISGLVESISSFGYSIRLRPHPRWTDMTLLRKHIKEINIEDNKKLSIDGSIASANYVIGISSTVLIQCVMSGREVILDDVIFEERYKKLKMLDYILNSKPHKQLSELLLSFEKRTFKNDVVAG
jgi:hypothetical protein